MKKLTDESKKDKCTGSSARVLRHTVVRKQVHQNQGLPSMVSGRGDAILSLAIAVPENRCGLLPSTSPSSEPLSQVVLQAGEERKDIPRCGDGQGSGTLTDSTARKGEARGNPPSREPWLIGDGSSFLQLEAGLRGPSFEV